MKKFDSILPKKHLAKPFQKYAFFGLTVRPRHPKQDHRTMTAA